MGPVRAHEDKFQSGGCWPMLGVHGRCDNCAADAHPVHIAAAATDCAHCVWPSVAAHEQPLRLSADFTSRLPGDHTQRGCVMLLCGQNGVQHGELKQ